MVSVQLPVQLPCKRRVGSVSAGPCLHCSKLHACTRAARLLHVIGSRRSWKDLISPPCEITFGITNRARGYIEGPCGATNTLTSLSLGQAVGQIAIGSRMSCNKINALSPCLHRFVYPNRWRNLGIRKGCFGARGPKDRGGVGGTRTLLGASIIDVLTGFRGSSENSVAFRSPKILGGPVQKTSVYK
jgi:hypothetical protein